MTLKRKIAAFALVLVVFNCSSCSNRLLIRFSNEKARQNVQLRDLDVGGYGRKELEEVIRRLAVEININSANAILDEKKWVVISREKCGKRVNIEKTIEKVLSAQEGQKVEPVVEKVRPLITTGRLKANIVEIASFSTPLKDKSPGRVKNIRLAAKKLDFVQVKPGEEFSFNKVVGKRTIARGFEEAPIIVETPDGAKKDYEVGGGVCQVATTLFNAVKQCGFQITERHIHSGNVTYVPRGQDATVYYGSVDFRFRNNRIHPVMLRTIVDANSITIKIFENRN